VVIILVVVDGASVVLVILLSKVVMLVPIVVVVLFHLVVVIGFVVLEMVVVVVVNISAGKDFVGIKQRGKMIASRTQMVQMEANTNRAIFIIRVCFVVRDPSKKDIGCMMLAFFLFVDDFCVRLILL
jgi:hypothetical protein